MTCLSHTSTPTLPTGKVKQQKLIILQIASHIWQVTPTRWCPMTQRMTPDITGQTHTQAHNLGATIIITERATDQNLRGHLRWSTPSPGWWGPSLEVEHPTTLLDKHFISPAPRTPLHTLQHIIHKIILFTLSSSIICMHADKDYICNCPQLVLETISGGNYHWVFLYWMVLYF